MATIQKRGKKYQAQVACNGIRKSKTFTSRSDAQKWAKKIESEIERSVYIDSSSSNQPFSNLLELYEREVLPRLKGKCVDGYRINRLKQEFGPVHISKITPDLLRRFRDERLKLVKPGTVRKDLGMISRILNAGEKDFGIILPLGNPVSKIRMPEVRDERDRRLSVEEAQVIEQVPVFSFAIETAMRRGEIAAMKWQDVDLASRELLIPETKTGKPRKIPLSTTAIKLLKNLKAQPLRYWSGSVWNMKTDYLSRSFMRLCRKKGFEDLRFHDLRHEATSRFFELGLNPVEVASITGHTDTRMLMRYTHLKTENLAVKLG